MLPQNITIAHRTNCSILNELHLPTNWMYNFVRRQKLKYVGHVSRHNDLEKTIMQGMVAGKRSRGKPRQIWEQLGYMIMKNLMCNLVNIFQMLMFLYPYLTALINRVSYMG